MIFYLIWGYLFPYKTKKKRVEIYKAIIHLIDEGYKTGLCIFLNDLLYTRGNIIWKFPELYKHKPVWKSSGKLWWSTDHEGMQKRKQILQKIINKYEQRKNQKAKA